MKFKLCLILFLGISGWANAQKIAAGSGYVLVVCSDGLVWGCGLNKQGQLGDNTRTDRLSFVQSKGLTDIVAVSAFGSLSAALKKDGTVWVWGTGRSYEDSLPKQVAGITEAIGISAGASHVLAVKKDSTLWAWGDNVSGQLGDGTNVSRTTFAMVPGLTGIQRISAGSAHSLVLKKDGTVWAWGANFQGQLGDSTYTDRNVPLQPRGLTDITDVGAGSFQSFALKNDGTLWGWGNGPSGEIGDTLVKRSAIPIKVRNKLTDVVEIEAAINSSYAIRNDGTAWAWGRNLLGGLGNGVSGDSRVPVQVKNLTNVVEITAGLGNAYALTSDGKLWAWGRGTLGDGTSDSSSVPVLASTLPCSPVTDITVLIEKPGKLLIYPNPSGGAFTVSYPLPASTKEARFTVYDLRGAIVVSRYLDRNESTWSLSADTLQNGIYLMSLELDGLRVAKEKLVVVR
jgi:alpha-tubulin suppressor-like RCC1 family protein